MSEPILFATDAWIKQLMVELNSSETYREAARTWEGDLFFIIEPEGALAETVYLYVDLWHGECRQAFVAVEPASLDPEFRLTAPVRVWKQIIERKLDPIKAMLTRKLKLQGNMAKIMKHVKAANEMVNCTTNIKTSFPID
ncbi:MAG: SCP2 sterol-binding domain-containing protein [Anaerolineae bacterium]